MKKKVVLVIIVLIAIIIVSFLIYKSQEKKVCFNGKCIKVKLAETPADREKGLMFKENLANDTGMLFIFSKPGLYPFWMKNTLIPLDIIWIDEDREIVYIIRNNLPCNDSCSFIAPDTYAKYVLEINAGISDKLGIETGDVLDFQFKYSN